MVESTLEPSDFELRTAELLKLSCFFIYQKRERRAIISLCMVQKLHFISILYETVMFCNSEEEYVIINTSSQFLLIHLPLEFAFTAAVVPIAKIQELF